jgi:hypothetical protein
MRGGTIGKAAKSHFLLLENMRLQMGFSSRDLPGSAEREH